MAKIILSILLKKAEGRACAECGAFKMLMVRVGQNADCRRNAEGGGQQSKVKSPESAEGRAGWSVGSGINKEKVGMSYRIPPYVSPSLVHD